MNAHNNRLTGDCLLLEFNLASVIGMLALSLDTRTVSDQIQTCADGVKLASDCSSDTTLFYWNNFFPPQGLAVY